MALSNDLNPEIFAALAMQGFRKKLAALQSFATDFSGEAADVGDTVTVRNIPAFSDAKVKTVDAQNPVNYKGDEPDANAIKVTLDYHDYVPIGLKDTAAASNSAAQLELFAEQKGAALAKKVFNRLFGLFVPASFTSHTAIEVADTSFDGDEVRALIKVLTGRDADVELCNLLLHSDYYTELLGDINLNPDATGNLQGYGIRQYIGIPGLPDNGQQVAGILVHPSAAAVAMRYLAPQKPEAYLAAFPVTDENGFTFGYREGYDQSDGTHFAALEAVYGFKVGNTDAVAFLQRPAA